MMSQRRVQSAAQLLAVLTSAVGGVSARSMASASCFSSAAFASPACHRSFAIPPSVIGTHRNSQSLLSPSRKNLSQMKMSFFGGPAEGAAQRIDKAAMKEIIEDVANSSRKESGYVIIDVRGYDEIEYTGKLDDVVETLPLPFIAEGALMMDEEEFEEQFGFEKPRLDETIVFSCKAGIRSASAAQLAKMAGYTDILDYMGGSNEWFY